MANIFAQYLRPPKSVAEYGAEYDTAEGNKLALAAKRMQMQQAERGMADDAAVRGLVRQHGGDQNALVKALYGGGYLSQAQGIEKSIQEQLKGKSDIAKSDAEAESKRFAIASQKIDIAGKAFGFVRDNPSPENAQRVVQSLVQGGIWNQQQGEKAMAEVMANPTPEAIKALATQAFQQTLAAKDQLPQYMQQNRGGTQAVMSVNPITGQAADIQTANVTQTPDNAATQATSIENNKRTVGASLQNAEAQRAMAQAQNNQTNAWQSQMRDLQLDKARTDKESRDRSKQAAVDSVSAQLTVIDKALDHPGRETATGVSGAIDPRNYIPGTQATDFRVVLDQINGTAFLQAFESLKGGGQITNVEGQKGTDAIARLNRAQSDEEFKVALEDLRGVMEKGYERLTGQQAPQRPKPTSPTKNGPKPGAVEGGYRFKGGNPADPKNWEKQ